MRTGRDDERFVWIYGNGGMMCDGQSVIPRSHQRSEALSKARLKQTKACPDVKEE